MCADSILSKLETPTLKLMARKPDDVVNGSVTIYHLPKKHIITIEIYYRDELPNTNHESTLKRPVAIPNKAELNSRF